MTTDPAVGATAAADRLTGVWNIVPTPFLDDGSLDEASLPTLTRFVAGCGVDGMTILGVLGEAAKLSDTERGTVIRGVIVGRRRAAGLRRGHARGHRPGDRLRPRGRRRGRALGHARAAARSPRPNDDAVLAHYLAVAAAVDLPVVVQDHPASSGVDDVGRAADDDRGSGADMPGHQARGRAQPAQGRPPARRPAGPADPRRPRRDHAAGGAAPRGGRDDDRVRVP